MPRYVRVPQIAHHVINGIMMILALGLAVQVSSARQICQPLNIGSTNNGSARDVEVVGSIAYVADGSSGLQVIDVSSCRSCPADINSDTIVNVTDLLAILAPWGPCP